MSPDSPSPVLAKIHENIQKYGSHTTVVAGGPLPRYAYTIGLKESVGYELVVAGALYYSIDEVLAIMTDVRRYLESPGASEPFNLNIEVEAGSFALHEAHPSWINLLLIGALDYYGQQQVKAIQIVPIGTYRTIDVPSLDQPWSKEAEPIWRWTKESWKYPVPPSSISVTNLRALQGEKITEVARWEPGEWEMFAGSGPDVARSDVRIAPLGTLLAADPTLEAAMNLEEGAGLWRESIDLGWHPWSRVQ